MPSPLKHAKKSKARRDKFIRSLQAGRFAGRFKLEWISPELFRYLPDDHDPFRYIRMDEDGHETEVIQPQVMETDGASIPKAAQLLLGTSSWEYGPAFMIHDWEFEAHDRAREEPDFHFDKSFEEVNLTLAEALWTLMKKGYLDYPKPRVERSSVYTIYQAVMSPIGRIIWDG